MKYDEILEKIVEETSKDKEEIKEEVKEKMEEFEGLVSEEGAIHLVAKENEVEIQGEAENNLKIKNIVPEMRKLHIKARVANIMDINTFERDEEEEDGKVQNMVLGDDTGTIRVTLWDDQTQITEKISEGDPLEITGAYTVEDQQGNAEIRLGDNSQVKMADEDEVPELDKEVTQEAAEVEIGEISGENGNYKVSGMIMAIYTSSPFYKTDKETGKTVRENDDGEYETKDGEKVEETENALAISGVIDDGTGALRTVFFREDARKVLEVDEETEKEGDLKKIEEAAKEATGKEITIEGRTRYNDYFDQIEILVNKVEEKDSENELEKLLDVLEA